MKYKSKQVAARYSLVPYHVYDAYQRLRCTNFIVIYLNDLQVLRLKISMSVLKNI